MNILITSGGGGHFAPALAVIRELPEDTHFLVVGRKYAFENDKTIALEYRTANALGIPFTTITTARLQRTFTRHTIPSFFKFPVGFFQARQIIKKFKPDAVLSFGGYIAVPITLAAKSLQIPVVIHEQTLGAGLANRIASPFAERICLSFEESKKFFPPSKSVVTGNPLREEFLTSTLSQSPVVPPKNHKLIYITGGSLGSHALNALVEKSLGELTREFTLFHQTGDAQEFQDYDRLMKRRDTLPKEQKERYILTKFVNPDSVGALMKTADLVIARAGINTISELMYVNTPSLLIPLPHGQNNEQLKNAQFLASLGLSEVLEQERATPESFIGLIHEMVHNIKRYTISPSKRKELIREDAASNIIRIVQDVTKEKTHQATN